MDELEETSLNFMAEYGKEIAVAIQIINTSLSRG